MYPNEGISKYHTVTVFYYILHQGSTGCGTHVQDLGKKFKSIGKALAIRLCSSDWLSATLAIFLCSPVIAEAVEKWKMEREARLARGEEEEEENI